MRPGWDGLGLDQLPSTCARLECAGGQRAGRQSDGPDAVQSVGIAYVGRIVVSWVAPFLPGVARRYAVETLRP